MRGMYQALIDRLCNESTEAYVLDEARHVVVKG